MAEAHEARTRHAEATTHHACSAPRHHPLQHCGAPRLRRRNHLLTRHHAAALGATATTTSSSTSSTASSIAGPAAAAASAAGAATGGGGAALPRAAVRYQPLQKRQRTGRPRGASQRVPEHVRCQHTAAIIQPVQQLKQGRNAHSAAASGAAAAVAGAAAARPGTTGAAAPRAPPGALALHVRAHISRHSAQHAMRTHHFGQPLQLARLHVHRRCRPGPSLKPGPLIGPARQPLQGVTAPHDPLGHRQRAGLHRRQGQFAQEQPVLQGAATADGVEQL